MKAIYIIIVHAILPLQLYSYDGHGSGCGELKDIERISNPSPDVEGYKEKAEDFAKKIEKESLDHRCPKVAGKSLNQGASGIARRRSAGL